MVSPNFWVLRARPSPSSSTKRFLLFFPSFTTPPSTPPSRPSSPNTSPKPTTASWKNPNEAIAEYGQQLTRGGKSGLAKLLGPQLTDYIAPLAKSNGLGEGKIASALGTIAPFVFALLGQQSKDAQELQALLTQEEIAAPTPDTKVQPKQDAPQKSYLPDPTKKKEKRPFPKRKAILIVFLLALVAALLFWLVDTGVIPLPDSIKPQIEPENTPSIDSPIEPNIDPSIQPDIEPSTKPDTDSPIEPSIAPSTPAPVVSLQSP